MPIVSPLWLLGAALAGQPVPGLKQIMAHPDWVARPARRVPEDVWKPRVDGPAGLGATARWYEREGWL